MVAFQWVQVCDPIVAVAAVAPRTRSCTRFYLVNFYLGTLFWTSVVPLVHRSPPIGRTVLIQRWLAVDRTVEDLRYQSDKKRTRIGHAEDSKEV